MDLFKELINLPNRCIYGLFNEKDQRVYIGFTNNIIVTLPRLINDIKYSNNLLKQDIQLLEFRIIETLEDKNALRIRYQYWVREYSNKGYQLYRDYKAVEYKLSIDIIKNPFVQAHTDYLFGVKLVSRGYNERIVGIFRTMVDADAFVSSHYRTIDNIIYADNELTRDYLKLYGNN